MVIVPKLEEARGVQFLSFHASSFIYESNNLGCCSLWVLEFCSDSTGDYMSESMYTCMAPVYRALTDQSHQLQSTGSIR